MSGLISVPIMLFYIFICLFIFIYIKNNIEKKYLAKYFLIMMLTFPFWDLIVQKGIKTFIEVSGVLEPKVFNLPEKDSNGKFNEKFYKINIQKKENKTNLDDFFNRYKFKEYKSNYLNLFNLTTYQLFDFNKNIVIGEIYTVSFYMEKSFFKYIRNDIFFLITGSGASINYVSGIWNLPTDFKTLIEKLK